MQAGATRVASNEAGNRWRGAGGLQRRLPTGGAAKGIPRNTATDPSSFTAPRYSVPASSTPGARGTAPDLHPVSASKANNTSRGHAGTAPHTPLTGISVRSDKPGTAFSHLRPARRQPEQHRAQGQFYRALHRHRPPCRTANHRRAPGGVCPVILMPRHPGGHSVQVLDFGLASHLTPDPARRLPRAHSRGYLAARGPCSCRAAAPPGGVLLAREAGPCSARTAGIMRQDFGNVRIVNSGNLRPQA